MADIEIRIDPTSIKSIQAAKNGIGELGKKFGWTDTQMKDAKKSLDSFLKSLSKVKVSSPFSKLVTDTKEAERAFDALTASYLKYQKTVKATLGDDQFMVKARNAKALLSIEGQLNAELEKQAVLVAKVALEQGKGSNANLQAAKNLATMKAGTAELVLQDKAYIELIKHSKMLNQQWTKDVTPFSKQQTPVGFSASMQKQMEESTRQQAMAMEVLNKEIFKNNGLTAKNNKARADLKQGAYAATIRKEESAMRALNAQKERYLAVQSKTASLTNTAKSTVWLKQYSDRMRVTTKEIEEVGKEIEKVGKETEKAGKHQRSFMQDFSKGALASTGKIWMAYAGNMAAMTTGFVAAAVAVKSFNDAIDLQYLLTYSDAIGELAGNSNELGNNFGNMTNYILEMRGVAAGPIEAAEGMRELIKAGKSVDEIVGGDLVKSLSHFASVAEMDLATAIQLAVTQVNAFDDVTKDATGGLFDYADAADMMAAAVFNAPITFGDLAQSLKHTTELAVTVGASFDEITTALSLMGEAGIKGSQAGTALRTGLTKLVTPTKDLSAQIRILGGDIEDAFDADGTMNVKKSIGLYKEMYDQLDSIARVQFIKDVFGLRSQKAIAAMMKSFDDWDERHNTILNSQGNIETAYAKISETVKISGQEFKSAFSKEVMAELLPLMEELPHLIDAAAEHVDDMVATIKLASLAATTFVGVWTAVKLVEGLRVVKNALLGIEAANIAVAASGSAAAIGVGASAAAIAGRLTIIGGVAYGLYQLTDAAVEKMKEAAADIPDLEAAIKRQEGLISSMKAAGNSLGLAAANMELGSLVNKLAAAEGAAEALAGTKLGKAIAKEAKEAADAIEDLYSRTEASVLKAKSGMGKMGQLSAEDVQNLISAEKMPAKLAKDVTDIEFEISIIGMDKYEADIAKAKKEAAEAREILARTPHREESVNANAAIDEWLAAEIKLVNAQKDFDVKQDAGKGLEKYNAEIKKVAASLKELASAIPTAAMDEHHKIITKNLVLLGKENTKIKESSLTLADKSKLLKEAATISAENTKLELAAYELAKKKAKVDKDAAKALSDYTDLLEEHNKTISDADFEASIRGLTSLDQLLAENVKKAKELAAAATTAGAEGGKTWEAYNEELIKADKNSGKFKEAVDATTDELITQGKESENLWDGFNAGILEAVENSKTLGMMGYEIAGSFREGIKDSFVAIFKGEFDKIGDIWDATLNSMLDSVIDWVQKRPLISLWSRALTSSSEKDQQLRWG